jgi:hypothetical protein
VLHFHHPDWVLDRAERSRRGRTVLRRRSSQRRNEREEDLLLFPHVRRHVFDDRVEQPRDLRQLRVTLAVNPRDLPGVRRDRGQRFADVRVVLRHDVIDELVRRPDGKVRHRRGRVRGDPVQFGDDPIGVGARGPARVGERLGSAAAEINVMVVKHSGGPEISGDDVANRRLERSSHSLSSSVVSEYSRDARRPMTPIIGIPASVLSCVRLRVSRAEEREPHAETAEAAEVANDSCVRHGEIETSLN